MLGQRDDVAGALTERGELEIDDVQAEQQILAEAALPDLGDKLAI